MVDAVSIRHHLSRIGQSTRIVMRCLGNGKDYHSSFQATLALLIDILELIYCIRDQTTWAEENQPFEGCQLSALNELLGCFDVTLKSMEKYFQPGGIGVRYYRKHLLDRTFLPLLEQYKIAFIFSRQLGPV